MKRRPALSAGLRCFVILLAAVFIGAQPACFAVVTEETLPSITDTRIEVPPLQLAPPDDPRAPSPSKIATPVEEPLLPLPAGPILDQARVLNLEDAASLHAHLMAARAQDVWVYVLTVPSLSVLPSRQKDTLDHLAKRYAHAWTPKTVGAVLIFDGEGGLMSTETSPEAVRRFSDVAIQIDLEEALAKIQEGGLSRKKLEHSATVVADVLCTLQAKYREESGRHRVTNLIMGGIAVFGLGLAIWGTTAGSKRSAPEKVKSQINAGPRKR